MARLRGVELGKEVGYAVRFERYISSRTRIAYVTDGMLERWLTEWPSLEGVSAVVFDEFHERSLSGDLSLGRVLDLQEGAAPGSGRGRDVRHTGDIRAAGIYGRFLPGSGSARRGSIPWKSFTGLPAWSVTDAAGWLLPHMGSRRRMLCGEAVREDDCGDVLVFMPGVYEIRKTVELLAGKPWMSGRDVFPFTGLWRRSSRIAPWSGGYPPCHCFH